MLVSVIVVSYNSSKTILETLESIEKQSFKDYEIIICDDGSKDNTVEICKSWQERNKNKKVKIIGALENQGVVKNINKGVKEAKGEWIKLIAGDDILLENCLKLNIDYVSSNKNINICFSKVQEFNKNNILGISPNSKVGKKLMSLSSKKQYKELLIGNFIAAPSIFIKKEMLEKYNYFDKRIPMTEDFPFWLKITKNGEKFYFLDEVTVGYRMEGSLSKRSNNIINYNYFKAREQVYEYYLKENVGILYKWHFLLDMKTQKILSVIFGNKRNKISDFIIRYIKILDPIFFMRKIKRDILWSKF